MPRYKDEAPAVRVYAVCDESKYLIVRNVPSLGCGDELLKLFSTYGQVAECKPMDAEDCEMYTDVYWIKFHQINNARFAKRKLDESVFLGNRIQVSYAPEYESLSDTKEKLEGRRNEVLERINSRRSRGPSYSSGEPFSSSNHLLKQKFPQSSSFCSKDKLSPYFRELSESQTAAMRQSPLASSDKVYFPSESMNQTVNLVREKLNKIQSNVEHTPSGSSKKARVDNRRRI